MNNVPSNDAPGGKADCWPGALVDALWRHVARSFGSVDVERIILTNGSSFCGTERPQEMKFGRPKDCYRNAYYAATEAELFYCEGFISVDGSFPISHAWVSPDGIRAIEVTLRHHPTSIAFFGISFPARIARRAVLGRDGRLPLLDAAYGKAALQALVALAGGGRDDQFEPTGSIASVENR